MPHKVAHGQERAVRFRHRLQQPDHALCREPPHALLQVGHKRREGVDEAPELRRPRARLAPHQDRLIVGRDSHRRLFALDAAAAVLAVVEQLRVEIRGRGGGGRLVSAVVVRGFDTSRGRGADVRTDGGREGRIKQGRWWWHGSGCGVDTAALAQSASGVPISSADEKVKEQEGSKKEQ